MELKSLRHIYFIGIGGIGMSALARYFKAMGIRVSGYDKTRTRLTDELTAEGMEIHFEDNIRMIPAAIKELPYDTEHILVVYTPAVPKDHKELVFFSLNGFSIKKRSEVLGMITDASRTIAVAGTHGKTTTSSLISHILRSAGLDPSAFLGGITQNYKTNLLLSEGLHTAGTQLVVVEADEYDRSFLTLHPEIAVITSVDPDHLDVYGDTEHVEESFSLFSRLVKEKLILKKSIVSKVRSEKRPLTYSLEDDSADYFARAIEIREGYYHFEIVTPVSILANLTLGLPGKHNVENAVAATAVACELGVPEAEIARALASFGGVKRRFDYQIRTSELVYIDDYAHHPAELAATIGSAKEMYPGKKITGIFQPHLYSRTKDFADDFARSLDLLDECILLDIYPARELPLPGITSQMLLDRMRSRNKVHCSKENVVEEIGNRKLDVLLTMGAGDIDSLIGPITEKLKARIA